jgi:periplasmic protein CpxP/Spy
MKKIILTALAIATLQFAQAQTQAMSNAQPVVKKEAPTPEQVAERQSNRLQKVLTLTDEQKQRVYAAIAKRTTTVQQLKKENRTNLKASIKPVNDQFVKDVNATLTPEQQKKWDDFRAQEEKKHEERMKEKNNAAKPAPTEGGNK